MRKWIGRYDNSDKNSKKEWFKDKSRAPKKVHRKTDFEMDVNNLPITEGKVHFIRLVSGDGTISVLNEDFSVGISLAHEYVWATIDTKHEQLMVYYREKNAEEARLVWIHEYRIGVGVKEFEVRL